MFLRALAPDMDWVDRANGLWSVLLLSSLALASFLLRVTSDPMTCFLPPEMSAFQSHYALKTVQSKSHFFERVGETGGIFPKESYHLYVPHILFMQAVGFFIPFLLWRLVRARLALDLSVTSASLRKALTSGSAGSAAVARQTASLLLESLSGSKVLLTVGYLVVKLLSLLNLLSQFIALTIVFHRHVGLTVFRQTPIFAEGGLLDLEFFPIGVFVDLSIQHLTNEQRYMFQCSLLVNDTYIRMFVFLWYWVLLLLALTLINAIFTVLALLVPALRNSAVVTFVRAGDFSQGGGVGAGGQQVAGGGGAAAGGAAAGGATSPLISPAKPSSSTVQQWASGSLGADGAFLLSLVSRAEGPDVAARLVQEMWSLTHQGASCAQLAYPGQFLGQGPQWTSQGPAAYGSAPVNRGNLPGVQGYQGASAPPASGGPPGYSQTHAYPQLSREGEGRDAQGGSMEMKGLN